MRGFPCYILLVLCSVDPMNCSLKKSAGIPTADGNSVISVEYNKFDVMKKACAPGCEKNGNCNKEEGRCECPWGKTGPTCSDDQLPNCRASPSAPPSCGVNIPKNCHCYRQCAELYCKAASGQVDINDCEHTLGMALQAGTCFIYQGKAMAEQWSAIPRATDAVDWYRAVPFHEDVQQQMKVPAEETFMALAPRVPVLHLSECPDQCNNKGSCLKDVWSEDDGTGGQVQRSSARCVCRKGWQGHNCSEPDPKEACWFDPTCGGKGTCVAGFCHCQPGYWGLACGRSSAWAPNKGSVVVPARTKLRIYMYELPWQVAFPAEFDDGLNGRDPLYTSYEHFLTRFLNDSEVRTENPHEANMFFIPMLAYFYSGNVLPYDAHVAKVIHYIKTTHPWWNRTNGGDHFFWLTSDRAPCGLRPSVSGRAIRVAHFGMSDQNHDWLHREGMHKEVKEKGCVAAARDIIAPPFVDLGNSSSEHPADMEKPLKWQWVNEVWKSIAVGPSHQPNRTLLFFFVGSLRLDEEGYSGGVRQAVAKLFQNQDEVKQKHPDVFFSEQGVPNYAELFMTSKFCICPYGHGWGIRTSIAILHGCIPVILQDAVWQPLEADLPLHEFSIRISLTDIPHLFEALRAYSDMDLARMRVAMAKHYQSFMWQHELGGRAYEAVLGALHARLVNQWAGFYRRHKRHRVMLL